MSDHVEKVRVEFARFMIGDRPHVFVRDVGANRRFLESLDADYWSYQAEIHQAGLASTETDIQQRAAAALRVAYGQGLEALFAMIGALVQAPRYPVGWMARYTNRDLRLVSLRIHEEKPFDSHLNFPSWHSVAALVFDHLPGADASRLAGLYGTFWRRLARECLEEYFEPEYNNLKHGMRAAVGGFSVSVGKQETPGVPAPPDRMKVIGGSAFGSMIWLPPRRLPGSRHTFELSHHVTRAWVPAQFVFALSLIGMSIRNVASRALIAGGVNPEAVKFYWPEDGSVFDKPWQELPSISQMKFGAMTDVAGWKEPTADEIRKTYRTNDRTGAPDGL